MRYYFIFFSITLLENDSDKLTKSSITYDLVISHTSMSIKIRHENLILSYIFYL